MTESTTDVLPQASLENDSSKVTVVYILQALGFFIGLTFIAGVIVNYVQREDLQTEVAKSHCRWQIRTFWFSLLWALLGGVLAMFIVGYLILLGNVIWTLYRVIKGWVRLNKNQPMYC